MNTGILVFLFSAVVTVTSEGICDTMDQSAGTAGLHHASYNKQSVDLDSKVLTFNIITFFMNTSAQIEYC